MRELGVAHGDENIVAIVENDSCAVDAIQVVTGCTFGKGNLVVNNIGKQVYSLAHRPAGEGVRVAVRWEAPPESAEQTEAWKNYSAGNRDPEVVALVAARKAAKVKALFAD